MTLPSTKGVTTPARNTAKVEKIIALNDAFRASAHPSKTHITLDLVNRGSQFIKKLLGKIKEWQPSKDPDETDPERSWGAVTVDGILVVWSIDYYDLEEEDDSPDPSDPQRTVRVLNLHS